MELLQKYNLSSFKNVKSIELNSYNTLWDKISLNNILTSNELWDFRSEISKISLNQFDKLENYGMDDNLELDESFFNSNSLKTLNLQNVKFSSRLKFDLPNLRELNLSNVNCSSLNKSICNSLNLENLSMWKVQFKKLPDEISNLVKLKKITVYNKLETIENIQFPDSLEEIDFRTNKLEVIPDSILKLSNIKSIDLSRYLKEFVSPFTYFEIVNPIFEEVWVKAKVKFLNIPSGEGILNVNKDLLDFFCPWIQSKQYESINIGGSFKRSEIINFIKERKYVKFLTGVSILHIKKNKDGNTQIYDSANDPKNHNYIKSSTPLSIIIPRDYNQIEVLENEQYYPPEKTNYSDLSIEENFVFISDKEEQKQIKNNKNTIIKKTPLTFNFKFN